MFFLPPTLHLGKTKENSMPKKRKGKFVGGTIKTALDRFGSGAERAANLQKLYALDRIPEENPELQRERILARNRRKATAERDLDRAMEDEGLKLTGNRTDKDALLKRIGRFALDTWKNDTGTEELPRQPVKIKDYPPAQGTTASIKSGGKIKKKAGGKIKKKAGGKIKKKGGGSVKSKYTTGNKRYSNGGKIYPR